MPQCYLVQLSKKKKILLVLIPSRTGIWLQIQSINCPLILEEDIVLLLVDKARWSWPWPVPGERGPSCQEESPQFFQVAMNFWVKCRLRPAPCHRHRSFFSVWTTVDVLGAVWGILYTSVSRRCQQGTELVAICGWRSGHPRWIPLVVTRAWPWATTGGWALRPLSRWGLMMPLW